jgi:hypothetical protein
MRETLALEIAHPDPFVDLAPLIKVEWEWKARELELLSKMPLLPSPIMFPDPIVTCFPIVLPMPEPA